MFRVLNKLKTIENPLLHLQHSLPQQIRTTFILKRRIQPHLNKKGQPPKKLRPRHYIYDLVENTDTKQLPNIDVILKTFVDGLGNVGDRVSVKPHYAYNNLLIPGLAVYATPDNEVEFKDVKKDVNKIRYSSRNASHMISTLARLRLSIIMNKDVPWVLEPWHIKASFRKCGYVVPETAITMPLQPITGPDLNKENKEFYITVTINNTEKVHVRCRIRHWSTDITERLPYEEEFWKKPLEPLFPEDAEILQSLHLKAEEIKAKLNKKSLN